MIQLVSVVLVHKNGVSYNYTMDKNEEFSRIFGSVRMMQGGQFRYTYCGKYVNVEDTPISLSSDAELKLQAVPSSAYRKPINSLVVRRSVSDASHRVMRRKNVVYMKLPLKDALRFLQS